MTLKAVRLVIWSTLAFFMNNQFRNTPIQIELSFQVTFRHVRGCQRVHRAGPQDGRPSVTCNGQVEAAHSLQRIFSRVIPCI
jgi:hypothetical protein